MQTPNSFLKGYMPSAKLIMHNFFNVLQKNQDPALRFILIGVLGTLFNLQSSGQDNSPYSRYGIGDLVPNTNIINRGMGGLSAAYTDPLSINFNNPASYSGFQAILEENSKKVARGRVLFDVGINIESRTLREPDQPQKFTASNALFSYVQLGIPVKKNWGLSLGLRPISRVSYKIGQRDLIIDPSTNQPIDSAFTEYSGNGGMYLASVGTGFAIKNFSIGGSVGYLFGNKEFSTRRAFINDTVAYYSSNHATQSSYGNIHFNLGAQYKIKISTNNSLTLGVYGNAQNTLSGSQDIIRETFTRTADGGDIRIDSVRVQEDIRGEVIYPSTIGAGILYEKAPTMQQGGWLIGVDYIKTNWDDFRFFGKTDNVQSTGEVRIGGQIRPKPTTNYWSNVSYRAGVSFGDDYITVQRPLSQFGMSVGFGLPLANFSRIGQTQFSIINVAMEYNKRGNNDNLLKENLFRLSLGLSLSDLWFIKRRYD